MRLQGLFAPSSFLALSLLALGSTYGYEKTVSPMMIGMSVIGVIWLYMSYRYPTILDDQFFTYHLLNQRIDVDYLEITQVEIKVKRAFLFQSIYLVKVWSETESAPGSYAQINFHSKKQAIKGLRFLTQTRGVWVHELRKEVRDKLPVWMGREILKFDVLND